MDLKDENDGIASYRTIHGISLNLGGAIPWKITVLPHGITSGHLILNILNYNNIKFIDFFVKMLIRITHFLKYIKIIEKSTHFYHFLLNIRIFFYKSPILFYKIVSNMSNFNLRFLETPKNMYSPICQGLIEPTFF